MAYSRTSAGSVQFAGMALEAHDVSIVADFWCTTLRSRTVQTYPGAMRLLPHPGRHFRETLTVTHSPSRTVSSSRVHLDLRLDTDRPDRLVAAGATVCERPGHLSLWPRWWMADPEGNAFCALPAHRQRPVGIFQLVVATAEPLSLALWWAGMIGGTVHSEQGAAVLYRATAFPWDQWLFDPDRAPKQAKNRMHWHLWSPADDADAMLAAGATLIAEATPLRPWWVLADPAGNEFCLFTGDDRRR